jgi:hypothetical protein
MHKKMPIELHLHTTESGDKGSVWNEEVFVVNHVILIAKLYLDVFKRVNEENQFEKRQRPKYENAIL